MPFEIKNLIYAYAHNNYAMAEYKIMIKHSIYYNSDVETECEWIRDFRHFCLDTNTSRWRGLMIN